MPTLRPSIPPPCWNWRNQVYLSFRSILFVPFIALYSAFGLVCTFVSRTTLPAFWRQSLCLIYPWISIYQFPANSLTHHPPDNTSTEVTDLSIITVAFAPSVLQTHGEALWPDQSDSWNHIRLNIWNLMLISGLFLPLWSKSQRQAFFPLAALSCSCFYSLFLPFVYFFIIYFIFMACTFAFIWCDTQK